MTFPRLSSSVGRLLPVLALVAVALLVAACAGGPTGSPAAIPVTPAATTRFARDQTRTL